MKSLTGSLVKAITIIVLVHRELDKRLVLLRDRGIAPVSDSRECSTRTVNCRSYAQREFKAIVGVHVHCALINARRVKVVSGRSDGTAN